MPVYGYDMLGGAPYKVAKTLSIKDVTKFHKVLKQALKSFTYSKDQLFTSRIQLKNQVYILAKYDFGRPDGVVHSQNTAKLDALVDKMNGLLPSVFGAAKAGNYRIDITGNWDCGAIIVMEKNPNFMKDKEIIYKPRVRKEKE